MNPALTSARLAALRTRWAAIGAAIAVTVGGGGLWIAEAAPVEEPAPAPAPAPAPEVEVTSFVPLTPCRMLDTRPAPDNVGDRLGPIGPLESITLDGRGSVGDCDLATSTEALVVNVTAIGATEPTNLQLYPTGESPPGTSNLNPVPGQPPTPNAATIALGVGGQFDLLNAFGEVDVIVDVIGAFEVVTTS
ncbi:MAG: hypothetical protein AAFP84_21925 [Actinomycetota bacterium]